jgi:hypothetical protein
MAGLNEQIKVMVLEAAAAVVASEKGRIINVFRTQLEGEAAKTLEHLITASKDELASARREAVEQMRNQAMPILKETNATLQKLGSVRDDAKVNLPTMCNQFGTFLQEACDKAISDMQQKIADLDKQLTTEAHQEVAAAHTAIAEDSRKILMKISEEYRQKIESQLNAITASIVDQKGGALKAKALEISGQVLTELETHSRRHLELISEAIADIAKKKISRTSG